MRNHSEKKKQKSDLHRPLLCIVARSLRLTVAMAKVESTSSLHSGYGYGLNRPLLCTVARSL
jgi:hypothetical protein